MKIKVFSVVKISRRPNKSLMTLHQSHLNIKWCHAICKPIQNHRVQQSWSKLNHRVSRCGGALPASGCVFSCMLLFTWRPHWGRSIFKKCDFSSFALSEYERWTPQVSRPLVVVKMRMQVGLYSDFGLHAGNWDHKPACKQHFQDRRHLWNSYSLYAKSRPGKTCINSKLPQFQNGAITYKKIFVQF